jgi:uncharacterized protein (DUF1778 family)
MMLKPKDERVELRASPDDVATWRQAAEAEEMTLSDWIRRTLNKQARKGK